MEKDRIEYFKDKFGMAFTIYSPLTIDDMEDIKDLWNLFRDMKKEAQK